MSRAILFQDFEGECRLPIAYASKKLLPREKNYSTIELDLMFMKHYAPNRCLYIKVAKLRTGVGSAETSYLQNCSVKLFKEHFKVQICKERLFEKNKISFLLIFTNLFPHHPLSADQV